MNRYLIVAVSAFLLLGLAAAWNGRRMRESLGQVEAHVASANQQRLEIGKLNAGFTSSEGRARPEDSVLAAMDRMSPWMVSGTPGLAGAAIGQTALRRTIWRPNSVGAERGLEVFENGQTLAAGGFDLAIVMVLALPLVILFAPRHDTLLLALGPAVSLLGILVSGAPLAQADTWMRALVWLTLTGLYGFFWVFLRRKEWVYWATGVTYLTLVLIVPGLAVAVVDLVVPASSRMELAAKKQAALLPIMAKTSRDLAPFYESHPEFVENGATPADYDRIRLAAEVQWSEAWEPLRQQAEGSAVLHRLAVEVLGKLSPASILYSALLETAGTGVSRQDAFEETAREFGRQWSVALRASVGRGHPLRPADLERLPTFRYQEQSLLSWMLPAVIGILSLSAWVAAMQMTRKRR